MNYASNMLLAALPVKAFPLKRKGWKISGSDKPAEKHSDLIVRDVPYSEKPAETLALVTMKDSHNRRYELQMYE